MFIDTNDIQFIIINLDGLVNIEDERHVHWAYEFDEDAPNYPDIKIKKSILSAINYALENYDCAIVSQFRDHEIEHIVNDSLKIKASPPLFPATDTIELTRIGPQIDRSIEESENMLCNIVYFCGDIGTINQAQNKRLGTICWYDKDWSSRLKNLLFYEGPDFIVQKFRKFKDIFERKYLGYFGEVVSTPDDHFRDQADGAYLETIELSNDEIEEAGVRVSGRYFRRSDPRAKKHALSLRIISSKTSMDRQKRKFASIIAQMTHHLFEDDFDCITRVPPRPSQIAEGDRLKDELEQIPLLKFRNNEFKIPEDKICPELITCTVDYPSQKDAGNYEDRRENVRGVFRVENNVTDMTVIVVDDVATSCSTLKEISQILYEAGAEKVIPMAISYHPENVEGLWVDLECPGCGSNMKPRHNRQTGEPFFGCENFFPNDPADKCTRSMPFSKGVRKLNEDLTHDVIDPFEDIDF